jgi:hypothetical protein
MQPELTQPPRVPPVRSIAGGLADDEHATGSQQGCGALGRQRGRAETSGHDGIETRPPPRIPTDVLRSTRHHLDPRTEAEPGHGSMQPRRTSLAGVEEHELQLGSVRRDHQTGEPSSGTEIEHPSAAGRDGGHEPPGVGDGRGHRPRPEEAEPAGLVEDGRQVVGVSQRGR